MGPCCDEYKSIRQAHNCNWARILVCAPTWTNRVSSSHTLSVSLSPSPHRSHRLDIYSCLYETTTDVSTASPPFACGSVWAKDFKLQLFQYCGSNPKQDPECSFRRLVTASQVAKLIATYDILTITLQPSARHVLTACSQHSLVANMASVASTMVNVNAHRGGPESIA